MEFIKAFDQLSKRDVRIAGGKGASLGEMTQAGIRVPPGFVVLASAFERFLEETDLDVELEAILKKVRHKDLDSVERASVELRDLIHNASMPKDIAVEILKSYDRVFGKQKTLVAVRSSATAEDSSVASWAGELESYLETPRGKLLERVKRCWSSLFTPRAIFYRFEKKLHKSPVSVAVVIQQMVESQIAGVCFTVHPVTKDRNQMVIEAVWGLGETIVGGMVTPDTYVVHKKDFSILDVNINRQENMMVRKSAGGTHLVPVAKLRRERQKISGKQLVELAALCKKIESHYHYPQDIEWAFGPSANRKTSQFYIVQSRPITTL